MDSATHFQPWAGEESKKNVKTEREHVDDAKLHRENVNPKHTQTASYDKESVASPSSVPGSSGIAEVPAGPAPGKDSKMDSAKIASMQQIVENTLSQEGRQRVSQLLEAVEALSGAERLLLYLRLPTGVPPHDPLKQPVNPLGSRAELQQTVTWIQTHLEVDPDVSLPKQDVYDEYIAHCMSSNMKPLSTADFGKVMKQVYPTVRPRRLGTRGNSRYCYAGLRKKIKLEVPQLPDLGESSKETSRTDRESDRIICDWAETKLGVKFDSIAELSRHLSHDNAPAAASPPPAHPALPPHPHDDPTGQRLMKQLKRKLQTQASPGRPKKNKGQEGPGAGAGASPPSTSYAAHHAPAVKHESELAAEAGYGYPAAYAAYDARAPYAAYGPPRALPGPALAPAPPPAPHPPAMLDYRAEPYGFEPLYARDLTRPPPRRDHHLPINLSSDASLDLSTERSDWQRRRPPEPPPPPPAPAPPAPPPAPAAPPRLPLPGKKLILETYQSETAALSPRGAAPPPAPAPDEFPRTEYLPKKMRAAEILGGKLAAARHAQAAGAGAADAPSTSAASAAGAEQSGRSEVAFLEDPKNLSSRSKSTAAALAREEQEAASPKAPTPRSDRGRARRGRARGLSPDSCCGLDGINVKTGMICQEKHSEILNRERVISICNIDKHDLDDYLNEGNSQEHEEELLKYFHQRESEGADAAAASAAAHAHAHAHAHAAHAAHAAKPTDSAAFLEAGPDPHDDHSQGKNEKISQLRELLAKNLKNQSGSTSQNAPMIQDSQLLINSSQEHSSKPTITESAFKPVLGPGVAEMTNGAPLPGVGDPSKHCNSTTIENGTSICYMNQNPPTHITNNRGEHMYNGNCHNEPQSPTTRTQQYDFVPISDGCQSPGNFHSKSPLGFGQRGLSPTKMSKPMMMGGSLQTSPISHSTAASPFVSPRNTPVPRSRLCPRPIPKLNGRKRRNPLALAGADGCSKPFAMPNDQKFLQKPSMCGMSVRYCQPMSAPPSPNILSSHQYKSHMFPCASGVPNGVNNMCLNFLPNVRDNMNGELAAPLSADPLSSEVSQFFQESLAYRAGPDAAFRSQSVPLKQGVAPGLLSYANTPVGSVPPTPVPNEFCDFGLGDACDISRACLNPETLDKIYDAIDSNNVLNTVDAQSLLDANGALTNGCDPLPEQAILGPDHLNSYIPAGPELLDRNGHFSHAFAADNGSDDVEEYLKRTNSVEFDLSALVADRGKYYTSRSVPSTPLPFKRAQPGLQIDSRRSRELFAAESYPAVSNGISSKSVPSTPQLSEERNVFSYSNRDYLINGNSVEVAAAGAGAGAGAAAGALGEPLHDILCEDALDALAPAEDLLADLEKIDGAQYEI